ncbi:ABC transporter ATP-binding protein [Irregularibacter muris]|uniref:ABC transporter ATP-binding protein n=1 Tax=Irregularibacter muris TaxID=1796619 RepID=A0AAE3L4K4_9FIRM|nr:ABC transporter ATP-binding protein [Irregularibacter muris]MCR1900198.1 ABC transporter ATP-binding protein [Irregularibacter muris]
MLIVSHLSKNYGKLKALEDVSFEVQSGEIVGLLGPNGAGKSTTLKAITGLLRPTSGTITIEGIAHKDVRVKHLFTYVSETPELYEMLTVMEHMQFVAYAYGLSHWKDRADHLLDQFDLKDKVNELGKNLSKGMKQKVAICTGLLHDPKLLIFDEPFIGLDPKAIRELKNIFRQLKEEGKCIFISSHLLDSIEDFCDRVLVLKNGKLIAKGTLDELRSRVEGGESSSLEDVFLEVTK